MNKVTLRLIRKTGGSRNDDLIRVFEDEECPEMYRITYRVADHRSGPKTTTFYMEHKTLMSYIADVLESLTQDIDPFHCLQVETAIHPSVLYRIDYGLDCRLVEDTISTALRRVVY